MLDRFEWVDQDNTPDISPGKVVCVGRNYDAHARELNNPIPTEPVIFIKPRTALCDLLHDLDVPEEGCHFETELALVIGERVDRHTELSFDKQICGIGLALDLTKRELQSALKKKGLPWELAKSFDNACPLSPILKNPSLSAVETLHFELRIDGKSQQSGRVADMIFSLEAILAYVKQFITLLPGDVVLTGTPEGVGPLLPGCELEFTLGDWARWETRVSDRTL